MVIDLPPNNVALAYAKVLEKMIASSVSPCSEEWGTTIVQIQPARPVPWDPRKQRTHPPENESPKVAGAADELPRFHLP
jgi:hypothetical protein